MTTYRASGCLFCSELIVPCSSFGAAMAFACGRDINSSYEHGCIFARPAFDNEVFDCFRAASVSHGTVWAPTLLRQYTATVDKCFKLCDKYVVLNLLKMYEPTNNVRNGTVKVPFSKTLISPCF